MKISKLIFGCAMGKRGWWKRAWALSLLCAATAIALPAQTFITLRSFDKTDGANPYAGLVQATDGNLYGTTYAGGANYAGTVFKITPSGTLTTLYSFCSRINCTDGYQPTAALVQADNGNFYGTTYYGGANRRGTVFKITLGGTLTTLHSFDGTDGANPYAGLVQATDGNFYGTTYEGGANAFGIVFKITPSGTLTTLYSFCSQSDCTDGLNPYAGLVQAANGNLYGTTASGGASHDKTVFEITPSGTLTTLHSFDGTDGAGPVAGLVQATNGNLYGTTEVGGANPFLGTVFKITPSGNLTTLHNFDGTDGEAPEAALVQATDGNFYGTTYLGGAGFGTIFKITPGGTLTTLHSFDYQDGEAPEAALVQAINGSFYGTTKLGGTNDYGTVFTLSVGLGSFVKTMPTSGKVGAAVKILGTDLTGAASVSFNGTGATFTVVSSSEIKTTVPAGATTGKGRGKNTRPHAFEQRGLPGATGDLELLTHERTCRHDRGNYRPELQGGYECNLRGR
jgi:uncharacterized repeat protein (TIGR03803 family)